MRNDSRRDAGKEATTAIMAKENELLKEKLKAMKYQLTAVARTSPAATPTRSRVSSRMSDRGPAPIVASALGDHRQGQRLVHSAVTTTTVQNGGKYHHPTTLTAIRDNQESRRDQRYEVLEKVDLVTTRRMMRHMQDQNALLTARLQKSDSALAKLKANNEQLSAELAERVAEVEQLRATVDVDPAIDVKMSADAKIATLNDQLNAMKRENQGLKDANDQFIKKSLTSVQPVDWHRMEQELLARLHELEQSLRTESGRLQMATAQRNAANAELAAARRRLRRREQRSQTPKLPEEQQQVQQVQQVQHHLHYPATQRKTVDDIRDIARGKRRSSDSFDEGGPSLKSAAAEIAAIFSRHKAKMEPLDENDTLADEVNRLRRMYKEVYDELEKVRNLLLTQYEINQSYATEVKLLQDQMDQQRREFELTLTGYVTQLRDFKKSTSSAEDTVINTSKMVKDQLSAFDLSRYAVAGVVGTSDVELKLSRLEIVDPRKDTISNVFLSLEFYNFELLTTPIVKGPRCMLDFHAIYEVDVSDLFVHYVENDAINLELFEVLGTKYELLASGKIFLRDLLKSKGPTTVIAGQTILKNGENGGRFAEIDFEVTISHTLGDRLRKQKLRPAASIDSGHVNDCNELSVHIKRSRGVDKLIENKPTRNTVFYIVYEVFDQLPHATAAFACAGDVNLDDRQTWRLSLGANLHHYLTTSDVQFVFFEEWTANDGTIECAVFGRARVPLIQLANNEMIDSIFQIAQEDGSLTDATVAVAISWRDPYTAPAALSAFTLEQMKSSTILNSPATPPVSKTQTEKNLHPAVQNDTKPDKQSDKTTAIEQLQPLRKPKNFEIKAVSSDDINKVETVEKKLKIPPLAVRRSPAIDREDETEEIPVIRAETSTVKHEADAVSAATSSSSSSSVETVQERKSTLEETSMNREVEAVQREEEKKNAVDAQKTALPLLKTAANGQQDLAALRDALETIPIPAPRGLKRPKVVEFSEPLHESIPPSERNSVESDSQPGDNRIDEENEDDEVVDEKAEAEQESFTLHLRLGRLQVLERSPLADPQYAKMRLFVEWKLLDLPAHLCETPESLPRPRPGVDSADFAFSYDYVLTRRQVALLIQWAHLGSKLEFTLVSDPGDDGECDDLGVAQVDLMSVIHDAEQVIIFFDVDGIALADLDITIRPSQALADAVIEESRI